MAKSFIASHQCIAVHRTLEGGKAGYMSDLLVNIYICSLVVESTKEGGGEHIKGEGLLYTLVSDLLVNISIDSLIVESTKIGWEEKQIKGERLLYTPMSDLLVNISIVSPVVGSNNKRGKAG